MSTRLPKPILMAKWRRVRLAGVPILRRSVHSSRCSSERVLAAPAALEDGHGLVPRRPGVS
jgi:hypothetical protein